MKRVRSLSHLMRLANQRRSIVLPDMSKPKPAAFLIGWPARMVYEALGRGLYVYERKSK